MHRKKPSRMRAMAMFTVPYFVVSAIFAATLEWPRCDTVSELLQSGEKLFKPLLNQSSQNRHSLAILLSLGSVLLPAAE